MMTRAKTCRALGAAVLAVCLAGCTDRNPLYVEDVDDGGTRADRGLDPPIDDASVPADDASIVEPDASPPPDQGCAVGLVRFELTVHPGGRPDAYCHDSCDTWLRIRTEEGEPVQTPSALDCSPLCSDCQPRPCAGAGFSCEPSPIPSSGLQRSWAGDVVTAGICGEGIHCAEQGCAPAGRYVAVMCAGRNMAHPSLGTCLPSMPATCVEVPFDLPASGAVVRGVLPSVQ